MNRLENKVAVVTGAAMGIGKAAAILMAQEGAQVIAVDVDESLEATVEEINQHGVSASALAYRLDISDQTAIETFAATMEKKYGRIDVLFNNAGIDIKQGRIHEYDVDAFDRIMDIDLRGTFLMTKFVLPMMMKQGGSIVNTASFSGLAADMNRVAYTSAKAGVINLTRSTAIEYGRENIRANAIAPGTIETPLVDRMAGDTQNENGKAFRDTQKWVTPLGRLGTPEEVAKLVVFLASDDSSFITGETITIDGGVMAYTWPGDMLMDTSWKDTTQ